MHVHAYISGFHSSSACCKLGIFVTGFVELFCVHHSMGAVYVRTSQHGCSVCAYITVWVQCMCVHHSMGAVYVRTSQHGCSVCAYITVWVQCTYCIHAVQYSTMYVRTYSTYLTYVQYVSMQTWLVSAYVRTCDSTCWWI
jgi:hypothetical protein